MKKQLFLGTALLAALSAFPQRAILHATPSKVGMDVKLAAKYAILNSAEKAVPAQVTVKPAKGVSAPQQRSSSAAFTWDAVSGSMNVYGVLVSNSKPLQYNDELNAVSFIHRKSASYQPNPYPTPLGAETGAIVALVSQNWGNWDSTCVWNDNTNWARYPQGGIYNPPMSPATNTSLANAYAVAMGPITTANTSVGWTGNFYASKKLDVFDNVASTATGAQQFITSQGATASGLNYPPTGKVDFSRLDFTATDDGVVRSLGAIFDNPNGTTAASQGIRGLRIVKGVFSSGTFVWTGDSISYQDATISGITGLPLTLSSRAHMAWNEAGTTGYVWYYGSKAGATGNNIGMQPIIYKTTNSGLTWTPFPSINFNDKATFKAPVLDHLFPAFNDTSAVIPFFNYVEGIDGTVDVNDQLHIMTTLISSNRAHPDSIFGTYTFPNWDGETYSYAHGLANLAPYDLTVRMNRPYIYDFYSSSTGWNVAVVDSMGSEAPGETPTDDGFADNPWDNTGEQGTKVSSDARMQMSRTPGGSKIIYTWAESDTGVTNQGRKWNHMNNLHVRLMDVNPSFQTPAYTVHESEYNLTANVTYVKDRAQMHNTSPKCAVTATAVGSYTVTLPIKVTNNQSSPMVQLNPVTHWYTAAAMEFTVKTPSGIHENQGDVMGSVLFPNPAVSKTNLQINLKNSATLEISVFDLVGQMVSTKSVQAEAGANNIPVNVESLRSGIYIVNVKTGNTTTAHKLILE
jgi:hypothetical protein